MLPWVIPRPCVVEWDTDLVTGMSYLERETLFRGDGMSPVSRTDWGDITAASDTDGVPSLVQSEGNN